MPLNWPSERDNFTCGSLLPSTKYCNSIKTEIFTGLEVLCRQKQDKSRKGDDRVTRHGEIRNKMKSNNILSIELYKLERTSVNNRTFALVSFSHLYKMLCIVMGNSYLSYLLITREGKYCRRSRYMFGYSPL